MLKFAELIKQKNKTLTNQPTIYTKKTRKQTTNKWTLHKSITLQVGQWVVLRVQTLLSWSLKQNKTAAIKTTPPTIFAKRQTQSSKKWACANQLKHKWIPNSYQRRLLPGKYFPTIRMMRFPALSKPWRRKNWRNSRSEKSSSGANCWEQSCHSSDSLSWFVKKGRASTPRSEANTKTEKSSDCEVAMAFF